MTEPNYGGCLIGAALLLVSGILAAIALGVFAAIAVRAFQWVM